LGIDYAEMVQRGIEMKLEHDALKHTEARNAPH
jgi:hypothetical protein